MENSKAKYPSAANECVRRLMSGMGLSLRGLAGKLGVSHAAVDHWRRDIDEPNEENIAALAVLAGSNGFPELGYTFMLLLSGSRLGSVFVAFDLAKKQVGLLESQLKHVQLLLANSDTEHAKVMLQHAVERAGQVVKEIEHDAHLMPKKPEVVEYRGRHNPAAN